jgi:hypothetical protein
MVVELDGSTRIILKSATGKDPEPVPSMYDHDNSSS